MSSSAKIRFLRNYTVFSDCDVVYAIQRHIIADPTVITDYNLPGESDTNTRPDQDMAPNVGAEQAPGKASTGIEYLWC
jgi:hypothetical protein